MIFPVLSSYIFQKDIVVPFTCDMFVLIIFQDIVNITIIMF